MPGSPRASERARTLRTVRFAQLLVFFALIYSLEATATGAGPAADELTPEAQRRIRFVKDALEAYPLVVFAENSGSEVEAVLKKGLGDQYGSMVKTVLAEENPTQELQPTLEAHFTGFKGMPQVFFQSTFLGSTAELKAIGAKGMLNHMAQHVARGEARRKAGGKAEV